jgi:hypothetical protein
MRKGWLRRKEDACIFALEPKLDGGGRGQLSMFNRQELQENLLFATKNPEKVRLILTLGHEQRRFLAEKLPGFSDLTTVEIPPWTERDLWPFWLCRTPAIEARLGRRCDAGQCFHALQRVPEAQRSNLELDFLNNQIERSQALAYYPVPGEKLASLRKIAAKATRGRFDGPAAPNDGDRVCFDRLFGTVERLQHC